jgi:hypothetical protein
MRSVALSVGAVLWSVCFGAAVLTVVPLSAMGLVAVFQGSSTIVDRLQGFGFFILGLLVVGALLVALTRITSRASKANHAQN